MRSHAQYMRFFARICMYILCVHSMYKCVYVCIYIYIFIYVEVYVFVYAYVMDMCVCVCINLVTKQTTNLEI